MARILVVDDDSISRDILTDILQDEGHTVTEAANGIEALKMFQEDPVELVFTDIFMPGKEGLETIKELLAIKPSLKIVAVTGGSTFTSYESLNWAQSYGAKHTLTKPFDRDEVVKVLKSLV